MAHADAADTWSVAASSSTLTYHLVHKLHRVDGVSKSVLGKARVGGGPTQVMVRAPVDSFDSANVNRDAHMKETVEAARYPFIELKALCEAVSVPAAFPAALDKTFKVQLTFHGVQQTLEVPVHLVFESATRAKATAAFTISLDAFKIERPSLMFVKVDDALRIDANLVFEK